MNPYIFNEYADENNRACARKNVKTFPTVFFFLSLIFNRADKIADINADAT